MFDAISGYSGIFAGLDGSDASSFLPLVTRENIFLVGGRSVGPDEGDCALYRDGLPEIDTRVNSTLVADALCRQCPATQRSRRRRQLRSLIAWYTRKIQHRQVSSWRGRIEPGKVVNIYVKSRWPRRRIVDDKFLLCNDLYDCLQEVEKV